MKKYITLIIFAIAFGFVEAGVVTYLRALTPTSVGHGEYTTILNLGFMTFIHPTIPILPSPLSTIETVRELATIVMLGAVSYLAAQKIRQRVGAFMIAFATWDIFYYIFLAVLSGWPKSLFDIDVYFLIPVPWIGPVITPIIISIALFIFGSTLFFSKTKKH